MSDAAKTELPDALPDNLPDDPPDDLPAAARRALQEAAERRAKAKTPLPPEVGGRDGPEPVRFGDWEKKGVAIDF